MRIANIVTFILLLIGGINWLCVGLFAFNFVDAIFGVASIVSSIVYTLVGISALWLILVAIIYQRINFELNPRTEK